MRLVSLPGLTGQSSVPGRWLLDRPVKPGEGKAAAPPTEEPNEPSHKKRSHSCRRRDSGKERDRKVASSIEKLRTGLVDVLFGLLRGLFRLRLGIRLWIQRLDGLAEANLSCVRARCGLS